MNRASSLSDLDFIQKVFELASQGRGQVSPNPLVGSMVVKAGEIVGTGFHRYSEIEHAEFWALKQAGPQAYGATLYTNLEPCSGEWKGKRTGSCAQMIIDSGIKRVVASMVDPNPHVSGCGFQMLRAAGIEVVEGLMELEARRLNEKFAKYITTNGPFVHLKIASSLDGHIATRAGESKWITGEVARAEALALRCEYDAILVGIRTWFEDDPLLTDRSGKPRHRPLTRVVLDSRLRIPLDSKMVKSVGDAPLIIFANKNDIGENSSKQEDLEKHGVIVVKIDGEEGKLNLFQVLSELGRRRITSLLVEGGAEVAGSFVENQLVDKVTFFIAPKLIGGRTAIPAIGGNGFGKLNEVLELCDVTHKQHGADIELTGYPLFGCSPAL